MLYAASLWFSNTAYLDLSVSFIQMTKSLMPGLVYVSGIMLGNESYKSSTAATMAVIAVGVGVCAYGEANLVLRGLVSQAACAGYARRCPGTCRLKIEL